MNSKDIRPIRPSEVLIKDQPPGVYSTFNALIREKWDGLKAVVGLSEAVKRVSEEMDISSQECFDRGYMDIENNYKVAGWIVWFHKGDPGESSTYTFSIKNLI